MRQNILIKILIVLLALSSLQCGKKESDASKAVTATVHPNSSLFVYRTKRFIYTTDTSGVITAKEIAPNSFDFGFQIQNGDGSSAAAKDLVIAGITMEVTGTKAGAPLTAATSSPDFSKDCAANATGMSALLVRKYYAVIPKNTTFIGYNVNSTTCLNRIASTSNNPETFTVFGLPINDDNGSYNVKVKISGWFMDSYSESYDGSGNVISVSLGKPTDNFTKEFYFQTAR